VAKYGPTISGISDAKEFANALVGAHFNSGKSSDGGRSDFVNYLVGIIDAVKVRAQCK
jgi:hypothetical protein